jgi:23S rRNA pseudouridine1911/1915/1917 synthase
LHAYRLAFAHPLTGNAMAFVSPLPTDIRQALASWGLRYNERQWLEGHAPVDGGPRRET